MTYDGLLAGTGLPGSAILVFLRQFSLIRLRHGFCWWVIPTVFALEGI